MLPAWIRITIATAALACVLPLATYQIALKANGLTRSDLWGGGKIRPITARARRFITPGWIVANTCASLSALTDLSAIILMVLAFTRRDRKTLQAAAICLVMSFVAGYFALDLGFRLAGI